MCNLYTPLQACVFMVKEAEVSRNAMGSKLKSGAKQDTET
jgi:hypothetical protein